MYMITIIQLVSIAIALLAFGMAFWLYTWVKAQPAGNSKVEHIGSYIQRGANTFLRREYTILACFTGIIALAILLFIPTPIWNGALDNVIMAVSFLAGAAFSALAGKVGIQVATIANRKAATASQTGIKFAFLAGFRGGQPFLDSVLVPVHWPCSPRLEEEFSPRLQISAQTSSGRWNSESPRTIHETRLSLQTMSGTMWEMWQVWEPTCLTPMSPAWQRLW